VSRRPGQSCPGTLTAPYCAISAKKIRMRGVIVLCGYAHPSSSVLLPSSSVRRCEGWLSAPSCGPVHAAACGAVECRLRPRQGLPLAGAVNRQACSVGETPAPEWCATAPAASASPSCASDAAAEASTSAWRSRCRAGRSPARWSRHPGTCPPRRPALLHSAGRVSGFVRSTDSAASCPPRSWAAYRARGRGVAGRLACRRGCGPPRPASVAASPPRTAVARALARAARVLARSRRPQPQPGGGRCSCSCIPCGIWAHLLPERWLESLPALAQRPSPVGADLPPHQPTEGQPQRASPTRP